MPAGNDGGGRGGETLTPCLSGWGTGEEGGNEWGLKRAADFYIGWHKLVK
jgi:hypothetical protein